MVVLQTERLCMRWFTIQDAPFLLKLLNDKDWIRHIGDRGIKSLTDAEDYIQTKFLKNYQDKGFGFYAIELKRSNELIGTAGIVDREGLDHVDIGYGFLPEYRGNGYAFEAAKAIQTYALDILKIDPIVAIVNPDNKGSIRILEKLGLQFEKKVRLEGEDKDIALYS